MKEYILNATVYQGYKRTQIVRVEKVSLSTGQTTVVSQTATVNSYITGENKIKYGYTQTRVKQRIEGGYTYFQTTITMDHYAFDLSFDLTGIPTDQIESVAIRAKLTDKSNSSPLGYYVSAGAADARFRPGTLLGKIALGYPNTPYEHDVTLSGLSATGVYTLHNSDAAAEYDAREELTFDTTAFKLVVVTREGGSITSTHKTAKVRLSAGTYTAFVEGGSRPMAMLIKTSADVYVNYYALEEREKITFTLTEECDVWVSVEREDVPKLMVVAGSETTPYVPYGEPADSTYIKAYLAEEVDGYIPTTGANGHYEYDELNAEGTNIPGSEENPGVWVAPTRYEERNLLQTKQINTFSADGIHADYYLIDNDCDVSKVEMYIRTRCKSVNGKDVPDPSGSDPSVHYYWKYIWTEIPANHATYGWTVTQASENTPITEGVGYVTKITFADEPPVIEEGVSIRVTYTPKGHATDYAVAHDRGYIEKCSIVTKFGYYNDNRFFLSGNPSYKNMDFMSAVDDPTYFPASGWTKVGSDMTAIQGYLHYGSELAIVKEDNNQDATVYMRSAILTEENNILFPVQQGAQGVGAISKWCLKTLKDEPLFLAKEGVYGIQGTDASQERNIPNRSFFVDKRLLPEASADCIAEVYRDYYIICNPSTGHCFVADARMKEGRGSSFIYDWYLWDNIPARVLFATDTHLYFGTQDGKLCVFNTDWNNMRRYSDGGTFIDGSTVYEGAAPYTEGMPVRAFYVTKRDHLAAMDYKKTILNDGGVITLMPYMRSSAQILVKTEKGEWFVDDIQTDSDEPSVVIPVRKRIKWFDSMQTRIENNRINEGLAILGIQYRYHLETNRR